jgi:hypothetical protein
MQDNFNITMDQLRIGLYVQLDLKWFDHPFSFSNFKIKNEEQIKTIRSLGIRSIRYDPALSDFNPLPQKTQQTEQVQQTQDEAKPDISPVLAAKAALVERIQQQREAAARIENALSILLNRFRASRKTCLPCRRKPCERRDNWLTKLSTRCFPRRNSLSTS